MANVSYKLKDLEKCTIKIGYVGENEDMHVLIDCKEVFKEYPNAVATMAIVPPEGEGYPKTVTRDGDVVEWLVTNGDVTLEGDGEFQLTFTEGEVIKKSTNGRFRVIRSISGSGEAPSGIQDWLTDANEKLAAVEEATQEAEAAASHQPYIGIDGYWYTWNGEEFVKNVKAQGEKGNPGDPGSPGDPTELIDDTAGEGVTDKTLSADKLAEKFGDVLNEIEGISDCFVEESGETVTLENQGSLNNFTTTGGLYKYSSGSVVPRVYRSKNGSETNPYVRNGSMNKGNHKWMVGFKWRLTKLVGTVGNPSVVRVYINNNTYVEVTPVFDSWQTFNNVFNSDLNYANIQLRGFSTAPQLDEIQVEFKDYFIYNVDDVSNAMLTVIASSQASNYQDGTVTYSSGSGGSGLAPDTTLKEAGKVADSKATGDAIGIPTIIEKAFSVDNKYLDANGEEQSATGYAITDYIDITGADAISFAGVMGSSNTVFWYDEDKEFISANLAPNEKMIWFYNILMLKPSTAVYVRCVSKKTSATNPPPIEPEVKVFYGKKYMEYLAREIKGDGVTDDTLALQRMVNMATSVKLPDVEKIKLTSSISVCLGFAKIIDGNGVTLIVSGNYYALDVEGTLTSSANPSSMNEYVLKSEGGTVIKNFKATSSDGESGGFVKARKSFNLKIENNYIYKCGNGIRLYGMNRDISISENHIFALTESGILFDQNINLHQCNINNNIIMFALTCIDIYDPAAIANFQITGNNIEIVNYPASGYEDCKCIKFTSTQEPGMFGEIEISGNTIQGHETSTDLIYFSGHADEPISDVSITGNHVSNSQGRAIYLENCRNIAITGNNYNAIKHYVYDLYGDCENILMVGETARGINQGTSASGGKIHADSSAALTNVLCKNMICTPVATANIETTDVTNVDVS